MAKSLIVKQLHVVNAAIIYQGMVEKFERVSVQVDLGEATLEEYEQAGQAMEDAQKYLFGAIDALVKGDT